MTAPEPMSESLRWLRYAREDLRAAERLAQPPDSMPWVVCFHAQQAAEKALKAVLVLEEIPVPFIHDLRELRELTPDGWPLGVGRGELERLTEWASAARYPGDWPDPTSEDASRAYSGAQEVYESIAGEFARRGVTGG